MFIMDETVKEAVEARFKRVYALKEEAKQSNSTATEVLNDLAITLSPNKDKYSIKQYKKIIKRAYAEWIDRTMGDKSTDDAVEIADAIVGENDE
jgi:hypothetical protein